MNVYFQAPPNNQMVYPCIVYKRDDMLSEHADNAPYTLNVRYQVTCIDRNPDSLVPGKLGRLPLCGYDRNFVADNLHHDVFNLYY